MVKLIDFWFALKNKNRREIYNVVLKKELNITEIAAKTNQKYPNVLKSLKILKDAEMISLDKRVTKTSQATFVKGIPFKEGTIYQKVYLKILEEGT